MRPFGRHERGLHLACFAHYDTIGEKPSSRLSHNIENKNFDLNSAAPLCKVVYAKRARPDLHPLRDRDLATKTNHPQQSIYRMM